jgi:competence protein ComEA
MESIADRLGISPWGVLVGSAAVLAAGLAGWWAFAAPAPPPAEQVLPRVDAAGPVVTANTTPDSLTTIVVHVDGAVRRPGVHELAAGSRVIDAIEAAAGLSAEADRQRLNLAAPVADGQRVWVPALGEDEPTVVPLEGGPVGGEQGSGGGPVNLNTADSAALETLPGIGPSIAGAILRHRDQEGAFERVEDLLEVAGIGPSRLAQLEPLVTV